MARHVYTPEALEEKRAQEFAEWVGPARKRSKASPAKAFHRASEQAAEMKDANDFASAEPKHFVGLYALLHHQVYGAAPIELEGDAYFAAVRESAKMLRDVFAGEPPKMANFMRWVWLRELKREKAANAATERRGGYRVGWRLQFASRALVTDYRVEIARAGRKVR